MASREDLNVVITAQDQSAAAINSFKGNLRSAGAQISALGAVAGGLGALGAGLSAAGIIAFAKDAAASLGKVADEADRVGTSTDALQALQFKFKLGGGEANDAVAALTKFADAASEAGLGGNYLTKVFQANNVALKDMNGNLRASDALLEDYAQLVANAATQQDKIMLATEAFGRRAGPKMVSVLEEIANKGLPGVIKSAKDAGQVVEEEMIRKADEIDDKWNAMLTSIGNKFKSFSVTVVDALSRIASSQDLQKGLVTVKEGALKGPDEGALELDREARRARGFSALPRPGFERGTTILPNKKETNDADRNRTAEILENLRLEGDQLTLNLEKKREAERLQMQINMVQRAGVDATVAEKEQIKGAVDALFAKKLAYEEAKRAQEALNDAVRFGGDMLADSITGLINKTKDWRDVMHDVLNSLTSAVIKSAILGEGPLAGIMGTKSAVSGGVGGILGAFFGGARADGGPVSAGKAYLVNENTPNSEIFVPSADGVIVPQGSGGGRGPSTVINNHYTVHAPGATPEAMALAFREIHKLKASQGKAGLAAYGAARDLNPASTRP